MALLNLNRYFESFQNVVGKITKTFSWLKRKFSDNIVDAIFLIIFAVIAIIIGIVLAIPYAFLLGEENILKWGFTHSFDISVLTTICFRLRCLFGVVRVMGGWFRMVLAIFSGHLHFLVQLFGHIL